MEPINPEEHQEEEEDREERARGANFGREILDLVRSISEWPRELFRLRDDRRKLAKQKEHQEDAPALQEHQKELAEQKEPKEDASALQEHQKELAEQKEPKEDASALQEHQNTNQEDLQAQIIELNRLNAEKDAQLLEKDLEIQKITENSEASNFRFNFIEMRMEDEVRRARRELRREQDSNIRMERELHEFLAQLEHQPRGLSVTELRRRARDVVERQRILELALELMVGNSSEVEGLKKAIVEKEVEMARVNCEEIQKEVVDWI